MYHDPAGARMTTRRKSHLTLAATIGFALSLFGCITEQSGLLLIEFDRSPYQNPISADTVRLVGRVVRSPPKRNIITTLTVTSGGVSVVDTTNDLGVFRTDFPLQRDTENLLLLTAADESGSRTAEFRLTIVHQSAALGPATSFSRQVFPKSARFEPKKTAKRPQIGL